MYCCMISTPGTIISVLVIIEKLCRQGKLAGTCTWVDHHLLNVPMMQFCHKVHVPFKRFSLWTVKTQVVENLTVLDLQKSTSNTCILYLYYEIKNKHALHVTGLIVVSCEYSYLYVPSSKECSLLYSNSDSFDISGQTWWKQSQGNSEEVER